MTRIYPAQNAAGRSRLLFVAGALALLAAVLIAVALFLFPQAAQKTPDDIFVTYTTERGEAATEGVVNSPLRVALHVPWSDGSQKATVAEVTLQLLDSSGKPAYFGSSAPDSLLMRPTIDITTWEYVGSVPSIPGDYHIRLHMQTPYDSARQQDYDLRGPTLQARADTGPTLRSGFVFNFESNLWIMSTDASSQRRLTYFLSRGEQADTPAWSPDGSQIAFTYTPNAASDVVPTSEIWVMKPDGSDMRRVAGAPDENLLYPAWSGDGKYIYFTAEGSNEQQAPMGLPISPGNKRRIDRIEVGGDTRSTWAASSHMLGNSESAGEVVYLEIVPADENTDPSSQPQRLTLAYEDGSGKHVLVPEKSYGLMYAPQLSPDGKWVVFSATNTPPAPQSGFNLLEWMGLAPQIAHAHVVPWDIYLVSTSGGTPTRLTRLDEDQPYPAWIDNSTIAFMGSTGLYKVGIKSDGKASGEPTKIHPGSMHGGLTWHKP